MDLAQGGKRSGGVYGGSQKDETEEGNYEIVPKTILKIVIMRFR